MTETPYDLPLVQKPSLGQALLALPGQYWRVLTRPSIGTFVAEKKQASWGIIWLQLLVLGVLSAIIIGLASVITPPDVSSVAQASGTSIQDVQRVIIVTTSLFFLILTPPAFFFSSGILYLIARLFGGKGTYLEQTFVIVLFGVPMVILSDLLSLIPATSSWLPWVPHLYSAVLLVFATIAVHRPEAA